MNARPILFAAPMIRALLAGTKTQTRRAIKLPSNVDPRGKWEPCENGGTGVTDSKGHVVPPSAGIWHTWTGTTLGCPYGGIGDLLWARETCGTGGYFARPWAYRADGKEYPGERWTPAIHMPRRASRLTLRITDVRVQRLQEISEDDAMAEGAPPSHPTIDAVSRSFGYADFPRSWFAQTWESINGAGSWDANPWVWAITFTVKQRNVDQLLRSAA